jgi:hypothetical protein
VINIKEKSHKTFFFYSLFNHYSRPTIDRQSIDSIISLKHLGIREMSYETEYSIARETLDVNRDIKIVKCPG